jgi:CRP-like cAMP-binding protein
LQVQAQRLAATQRRLEWPRHLGTNGGVALRLAELFATEALFDGDHHVALTQASLSSVVGLSRQRTNEALNHLRRLNELELTYGGIRVLNPARLMRRALGGAFD